MIEIFKHLSSNITVRPYQLEIPNLNTDDFKFKSAEERPEEEVQQFTFSPDSQLQLMTNMMQESLTMVNSSILTLSSQIKFLIQNSNRLETKVDTKLDKAVFKSNFDDKVVELEKKLIEMKAELDEKQEGIEKQMEGEFEDQDKLLSRIQSDVQAKMQDMDDKLETRSSFEQMATYCRQQLMTAEKYSMELANHHKEKNELQFKKLKEEIDDMGSKVRRETID